MTEPVLRFDCSISYFSGIILFRKEATMTRKLTYQFTGECPHTGSPQTIKINYLEIQMIGSMAPGYKKDAYSCPLADGCPYPAQDAYHRCPVYLNAPDAPC